MRKWLIFVPLVVIGTVVLAFGLNADFLVTRMIFGINLAAFGGAVCAGLTSLIFGSAWLRAREQRNALQYNFNVLKEAQQ